MEIVRFGRNNREYVTDPRAWSHAAGTDFMWNMGEGTALNTGGTAGQVLSEFGWTTTSLVPTAATGGADFGSTTDVGVPGHYLTNASGDLLKSPTIFGDYSHMRMAQEFLGYFPTQLVCRAHAAFSVATADEPTSGFGLIEDGGAITTEADQLAVISSDSANFQLAANGGAGALTDAGAAVDNAWHLWDIVVTAGGSVEWFIDSTSQGTVALTADEWPASFSLHTLTTNRILISYVHLFYR